MSTPHCSFCDMPLHSRTFQANAARADASAINGRFIDNDILLVDDLYVNGADLIETAEGLSAWRGSAVSDTGGTYARSSRTSAFMHLSGGVDASLSPFQDSVSRALHAAAACYAAAVDNLRLQSDLAVQILRYGPGQEFTLHADREPGSGRVYGARQLSAILYLNDDYEGGELEFPRQGVAYNPRAGSAIVFPSGFTHPHSSRPVKTGVKYSAVTWFI